MSGKPNIRRMPNRWTRYAPKGASFTPAPRQPIPDTLSEEDRALIAIGRQRPVAPEIWREIVRKGLTAYV